MGLLGARGPVRSELHLAFFLPQALWVSQLAAVAYYWISYGIDPFPDPVRVAGVRVDWPGAVATVMWGIAGYVLLLRGTGPEPSRGRGGRPGPVPLGVVMALVLGTSALAAADLVVVRTGSAGSLHGTFHYLWWGGWIVLSQVGLGIGYALSRRSDAIRWPLVVGLAVAPWVAYLGVGIPAVVLGLELELAHPVPLVGSAGTVALALVVVALGLGLVVAGRRGRVTVA